MGEPHIILNRKATTEPVAPDSPLRRNAPPSVRFDLILDAKDARIAALEEALRDSLLAHLHLPSDKCVVCDGVRSRAKALLDPAFTASAKPCSVCDGRCPCHRDPTKTPYGCSCPKAEALT